jgi:hypothetical protein
MPGTGVNQIRMLALKVRKMSKKGAKILTIASSDMFQNTGKFRPNYPDC